MDSEKLRAQMHELLDICIDTNGFEDRARTRTGTLPTIFFSYAGHVNMLTISIDVNGWERGSHSEIIFDERLNREIKPEKMDEIRMICKKALTDKKESDVLSRDIENQAKAIEEAKKRLSEMRKKHRGLIRSGK